MNEIKIKSLKFKSKNRSKNNNQIFKKIRRQVELIDENKSESSQIDYINQINQIFKSIKKCKLKENSKSIYEVIKSLRILIIKLTTTNLSLTVKNFISQSMSLDLANMLENYLEKADMIYELTWIMIQILGSTSQSETIVSLKYPQAG